MSGNSKKEQAFLRQFAVDLGKALREKEDNPTSSSKMPMDESVWKLYRALCFDEPDLTILEQEMNLSVTASNLSCRLLMQPTTSTMTDPSLAVCNRLVNGVVYLCQTCDSRSSTPPISTNKSTAPNHSSSLSAPNTSTSNNVHRLTIAKLAFCLLIQIPLACCQEMQDGNNADRIIGSYQGNLGANETTSTTGSTNENTGSSGSHPQTNAALADDPQSNDSSTSKPDLSNPLMTNPLNGGDEEDIKGELAEVWATESDPSDYDYGDDAIATTLAQHDTISKEDWLDPHVLSRPTPNLTPLMIRNSVASLLQQANYSLLESLFELSKKSEIEGYLSEITQLLLLLFHPDSEFPKNANADVQSAILSPLWVLRDAAMLSNQSPSSSFYTTSYLEVLQILLAVDSAHLQDLKTPPSNGQETDLCNASIVALSALSSWCSTATIDLPRTTATIVDSVNDLAHIVERGCAVNYRANLVYTLIPIVNILSGTSFEAITTSFVPSTGVAQGMMSSGLLRELMKVATGNSNTSDTADSGNAEKPVHFHNAIWGLCVRYPKIIGKYVFRYPGIAALVQEYGIAPESDVQELVETVLWNIVGYNHFVENETSGAPRMVWKNSSKAGSTASSVPLTKDHCETMIEKGWLEICARVETYITCSPDDCKQALDALQHWNRLYTLISGLPSIAVTFRILINSSRVDELQAFLSQQQLQQRQETMTTATEVSPSMTTEQPSIPNDDTKPDHESEKIDDICNADEDDGLDREEKKKNAMSGQERVFFKAKKLVKLYVLLFQDSAKGSSKTD